MTSIETSDLEFQRGRSEPESLPSLTPRADYSDKYDTHHHLLGSREEEKNTNDEEKKQAPNLGTIYSTLWSVDVSEGRLKGLTVL